MTRRVRIGLAALGRMGRIHAASLAARCPRTADGVRYTVKQENR
jgi:hypothetical protein